MNKWTKEQNEFLINNVKNRTDKELTKLFNKKFNSNLTINAISKRKQLLHLSNGLIGYRFKEGHIPFNKGKKQVEFMSDLGIEKNKLTRFKKGHIPSNYKTIGEERVRNGYKEIKVDSNKWQLKQRYIYEKKYNKIPKGYNIIFLDKNKNNLDISNLKIIRTAEDLIMKQNKLFSYNKELTETGTIIANVISETRKRKCNNTNKF